MVYFFLNIFIVIFALHWMLFLRRSSSRNVLYIYISMCIRVPESRSWKQFWKWFGNCGTAFRGGVVLLLLNKFWHGSLFFFSEFILERRKPFSVMIRRIEIFSNSRLHFVGMNKWIDNCTVTLSRWNAYCFVILCKCEYWNIGRLHQRVSSRVFRWPCNN